MHADRKEPCRTADRQEGARGSEACRSDADVQRHDDRKNYGWRRAAGSAAPPLANKKEMVSHARLKKQTSDMNGRLCSTAAEGRLLTKKLKK